MGGDRIFRKIRQGDLAMNQEQARALLETSEYAVVSMTGPDGYPYGFAVNYVLHEGSIYFHSAQVGHKMDCLAHSDKISLLVVGATQPLPEILDTNYESVVVFGRAALAQGEEKKRAMWALIAKYAQGYEEKGADSIKRGLEKTAVTRITIEHLTGKRRWKQ